MLIGLALRGAGIWGPSAVYDYDWQLPAGREPGRGAGAGPGGGRSPGGW